MFFNTEWLSTAAALRLREVSTRISEQFLSDCFFPLITASAPVSLRTLEWLVVNYSKVHRVAPNGLVCLHDCYQKTLRAYKRPLFDPFQRKQRIVFCREGADRSTAMETTVAQIAFLLWAYENGAFQYAVEHRVAIENHRAKTQRENKLKRTRGYKRQALTTARHGGASMLKQTSVFVDE